MTNDVMLTLALVALLTLSIGALLAVRASLRADIRTLVHEVSDLRLWRARAEADSAALWHEAKASGQMMGEHILSWHPSEPKPPARKQAAKKAPAKKAAPKKAQPRPRPGKSAPK